MLTHLPAANDIRGLRPVTPGLLKAEETARQWRGLPDDGSKGQLLQLLEDVAPKAMSVSKGARGYAHWCVKMQPAACFKRTSEVNGAKAMQEGLALVSTYPDAYVSAAMDVSVRTLARWRAELAGAGWIAFRDGPDRSRYRNGPAEAPDEAYGVDLRPLIVRFEELRGLKTQTRDAVKELLALRKSLSARKNRLRGLLALICQEDGATEIRTMIENLHRLSRTKSQSDYIAALDKADDLIERLEALVTAQAEEFSRVTQASAAPDRSGAQLNPTSNQRFNFKINLTDGYAARSEVQTEIPDPDDEDEEVVWCSSETYDEPTEVIEIDASQALRGSRPNFQRVTCPHPRTIVAALPALMRRQGLAFVHHPAFPDDDRLAAAYGQAAAHRLGITQARISALCIRHGSIPFAVAALLSEATPGIEKRRSYLEGLIKRLDDEKVAVDLWASWQRLVRQVGA